MISLPLLLSSLLSDSCSISFLSSLSLSLSPLLSSLLFTLSPSSLPLHVSFSPAGCVPNSRCPCCSGDLFSHSGEPWTVHSALQPPLHHLQVLCQRHRSQDQTLQSKSNKQTNTQTSKQTKKLSSWCTFQPKQNWEVDLEHLEKQLQEGGGDIRAIVINNPSNPCGSVYSKQHLLDILAVVRKYRVPIIADEVYMDMVSAIHSLW